MSSTYFFRILFFADYLQGRKDKKLVGYVIILLKMRMLSITICKMNMAYKLKAVT